MTNMSIKGKPRGHKPRPYSVTPDDQAKYESLNNRIKSNTKKKGDVTVKPSSEAKASDAPKSESPKTDEAKPASDAPKAS